MWLLKELYWQSSVKISIACIQAVRVADHCWLCTCQVCHCILNTLCCLLFYFVDGFDSILNFIFKDGISLKQFLWLNIINRIRQSFNTSALPFIVLCRCSLGSLWQVAVWKMSTLSTTDITDVGHGKTLVFLVLECEMFTYWIKKVARTDLTTLVTYNIWMSLHLLIEYQTKWILFLRKITQALLYNIFHERFCELE